MTGETIGREHGARVTPSLELRLVTFRVPELARALPFYERQLGFFVIGHDTGRARLGATPHGPNLLILEEDSGAPTAPRNSAGLFHAALLLPTRAALGRWLQRAADAGAEFDGFSDHGVSEAIYLRDPFGNGLEFYADRPRSEWPLAEGELAMTTRPLALPNLLEAGAVKQPEPTLAGARWGHLHLRVTELERSARFYEDLLGVVATQRSLAGARFFAADGYHHDLGLNTWGHPRHAAPAEALGLVSATFARRGVGTAQTYRDPDHMVIQVVAL